MPDRMVAACGFVAATALFAGDLTLRHYAGHGLFPMAAPTGGTLLIASWLVLAVGGMAEASWERSRIEPDEGLYPRRDPHPSSRSATLSHRDREQPCFAPCPPIR